MHTGFLTVILALTLKSGVALMRRIFGFFLVVDDRIACLRPTRENRKPLIFSLAVRTRNICAGDTTAETNGCGISLLLPTLASIDVRSHSARGRRPVHNGFKLTLKSSDSDFVDS